LSILFIDLIFALVFRNVANSMQIYGLFSTEQALTNKKGVPTTALRHRVRFERCLLNSFFRGISLLLGAILLLLYSGASPFSHRMSSAFRPNYSTVHILVAKNCENLLQVCIFARRKGMSTSHCCPANIVAVVMKSPLPALIR